MPDRFERIARAAHLFDEGAYSPASDEHPFDARGVHPAFPKKVRVLFDDGHFANATELAFKYIEAQVRKHSGIAGKTGKPLMMDAFDFGSGTPKIALSDLKTLSEKNDQEGHRFMFAGGTVGIRNPRAHEHDLEDDPDTCLDHLGFASMLLRRLETAGYLPS